MLFFVGNVCPGCNSWDFVFCFEFVNRACILAVRFFFTRTLFQETELLLILYVGILVLSFCSVLFWTFYLVRVARQDPTFLYFGIWWSDKILLLLTPIVYCILLYPLVLAFHAKPRLLKIVLGVTVLFLCILFGALIPFFYPGEIPEKLAQLGIAFYLSFYAISFLLTLVLLVQGGGTDND
jgi:hypothetical protein